MTEVAVAMPPVISKSLSLEEEDVAFKVLNQDNLPISIIGEAILKPFGGGAGDGTTTTTKQRGIVYPTRRIVTNLEENKNFAKSNGYIDQFDEQQTKKLNHQNSASNKTSRSHQELSSTVDSKFTRTLDAKLRKLQKDENKNNKKNSEQANIVNVNRKPFVTTVKKGTFLEPPPEIAQLIGLSKSEEELKIKEENIRNRKEHNKEDNNNKKQLVYAYFSKPRVLNRTPGRTVHRAKCEAAARAAALISGSVAGLPLQPSEFSDVPPPYANLMYEKRIFRGSNFAPCGHQGDGESAAARAAEARRRALARRKAKNQQLRAAELRLCSPPPVPGRKHEPVQTDVYLEEIFNNPPVEDMCTQTDMFLERPASPFFVPAKTGADVGTQIYPGDLFDFDMEVQPILEVLVGKTIEQALIEVLEEEELAALRENQRRFMESHAVETCEMQRIEERERRLRLERERRMKEHEEGLRIQKELEERIAAAVLMQGYMADLLPSVLEGLESEGFLVDNIKEGINDHFMPWLMKEVTMELKEMVSSRDVLTDIVREILENRAELYKALHCDRRPSQEEEEEEGPTLEDLILRDHLELQDEIKKQDETNRPDDGPTTPDV